VLTEAMAAGGAEAKRAFEAMMTMKKIDVARHRGGASGMMLGARDSSRASSLIVLKACLQPTPRRR
jgi:hypothetical protein